MSVRLHPRETGATMRCNYSGCVETLTTGQCGVRLIRAYAKTVGWIRGLDPGSGSSDGGRPSNRRWDVCPVHAVEELAAQERRQATGAARRARRDELRGMTPEERLAETKRVRNASARKRYRAKKAAAAVREAA